MWEDADNNGLATTAEPGIAGVLVQLLSGDGEFISEVATDRDGRYLFENLVAGEYSVRIPVSQQPAGGAPDGFEADALSGLQSSTQGEEVDPNLDIDNNDNGIGIGDWVASQVILGDVDGDSPQTEPIDETSRSDESTDDDPDAGIPGTYPDEQSNLSVDFGFFRLSLGNQVFFDANDNAIADEDEPGIAGVTVELRDAETNELIAETTTADNGLYLFDGLLPDTDYVVVIPATEFGVEGALENLFSSTNLDGAADPDGDETASGSGTDGDDNGADGIQGEAVVSLPVTLHIGDEPTGEVPGSITSTPDDSANLTCLLYTSPSPRDATLSRMPSSA